MHGDRVRQTARRLGGLADGGGQHAEMMGHRALERDCHPGDHGLAGERQQPGVELLRRGRGAERGGELRPVRRAEQRLVVVSRVVGAFARQDRRDDLGRLGLGAGGQQRQRPAAARLHGVRAGEHLRQHAGQLSQPALRGQQLPALVPADILGAGLPAFRAEHGRLLQQPAGLGELAGQQGQQGAANHGGVAEPRLAAGVGQPEELVELAAERGIGQLQQVGRGQQPGLQARLLVAGRPGHLGQLGGERAPLPRGARREQRVVLRQQAGSERGKVAAGAGSRDGLGSQFLRPRHVEPVPGEHPCQARHHAQPQQPGGAPAAIGHGLGTGTSGHIWNVCRQRVERLGGQRDDLGGRPPGATAERVQAERSTGEAVAV